MKQGRHITISQSDSDDSSGDEQNHDRAHRGKRKRKETKISCELCKARKVKCDKAEPSCGWCTKNNRLCVYKERRRPGLQVSYGIEIEDKINRIESSLAYLGQRFDEHINGSCSTGVSQQLEQPRGHPLDHIAVQKQHGRAAEIHWNTTPGDGVPNRPRERSGPIQERRQSQPKISNRTSTPEATHSQLNSTYEHFSVSSRSTQQATGQGELPSSSLLYDLVDIYFKHINTWSPILDRKETLDSLFGSEDALSHDDLTLLHAIVAVTLRFCNDPELSEVRKLHYYTISRRRVQLHALETPSITSLKALALITVDALGSSDGPQGWNLLALLARGILQLGLGVEKSVYVALEPAQLHEQAQQRLVSLPQPKSWTEDEGRRRLFWLTYILDRYATVATSSDFVLDDKETDRALPCRYDLFSKNQPVETRWFRNPDSDNTIVNNPENLGSFSYHCEVLRILSQIHGFLRAPIDIDSATDVLQWRDRYRNLDQKLNTWLSHLPGEYGKISQLCHSDPGSRVSNWIMIHAAFVTAVIRLHSVAAYPSIQSHIFQSSYNASQRCLAAVESLRGIAQDVVDNNMLDLLGPPFAFSIWVSARLLLVHAATVDMAVDPSIWFFISTLETMGQYWHVARNWSEILTRLVREGQLAWEHANRAPSPGQANADADADAPGKTYSEMRKDAHDLTLLTTQQPRTVIDPPVTRTTTTNEREYLETFEWFAYPKLPSSMLSQHHTGTSQQLSVREFVDTGSFSTPNPESDWLSVGHINEFQPPYE